MGDSPHTISGFGTALRHLDTYFHNVGHEVYHIGYQTFGQEMIASFHDRILGYKLLPNIGGKRFGDDAWKFWLPQINPDIFLTLADFWMLIDVFRNAITQCPYCMWYPIDGYPLTSQLKEMLHNVDYRICISEYGRDMVRGEGIATKYVPHGTDTSIFKPISNSERKEMRNQLGISTRDDMILFGVFSRNQSRKKHPRAVRMFAKIKEMYPELNMGLLLWMDRKDSEGWDMEFVCQRLGLNIGYDVFFPPVNMMPNFMYGVDSSTLAKIMASCDFHLFPTGGEGFGLTIPETMACGVLNFATEYTTPPEILRFGKKDQCGLPLKVETFEMGNAGVDRALVDVDFGVGQIKWALENPDEVIVMKENGIKRARKFYDWGEVVQKFDTELRDMI